MPLAVCEARGPKGLYRRARAGDVAAFTGISAVHEPPGSAERFLRTQELSVGATVAALLAGLQERGILCGDRPPK